MTVANERDESIAERSESKLDANSESSKHWLLFWAALIAASLPMLIVYLVEMWSHQHYRYIPFVFLVVGYLVWTRSDRTLHPPQGWFGWTLVISGVLSVIAALAVPSTWLGGVAFVLLTTAMIAAMRGEEDRSLLTVAIPLIMLIRLPLDLDQWLINRLQSVTTDLSSVVLDVIGVPHSIAGNTMQLVSRELFVAEACSGIQSVFTLAFIACVIVAINRRRLWLAPFYLAISVVLAMAGNTIRVSTVAIAEHWFARNLSEGWQHDVLGYVTLGIATLFLLSFDQLIIILLHPASGGTSEAMESPFIRLWNYLVSDSNFNDDDRAYGTMAKPANEVQQSPGVLEKLATSRVGWMASIGICAVLAMGAVVQATRVEINQAPQRLVGSYVVFNPKPELLQGEYQISVVGDHVVNRNGHQPRLGENADLWSVKVDQRFLAQVVVSQTYRGWHELCTCYKNMDWDQLSREVTEPEPPVAGADPPATFITARFRNSQEEYGYLLFSAVNEDGTIPEAPSGSLSTFRSKINTRLEMQGVITMGNLVMFQMWMVTGNKLDPDVLKKMQTDFVEMRARLATSVVEDAVNKSSTTSHRSNREEN